MHFSATFTVLVAALVAAPLALAMPPNFGSVANLKARGAQGALYVRNDDKPPRYSRHDPLLGPKPRYRIKDPNKPKFQKLERNGGPPRYTRDLDALLAREFSSEFYPREFEEALHARAEVFW
ncbi:hypothetical protein C8Q72DRAFT_798855 [Fomitopsis betulina]|nr:hypothetical protein C8Q72DRAFT_798855 [Fomitopsis betulina]